MRSIPGRTLLHCPHLLLWGTVGSLPTILSIATALLGGPLQVRRGPESSPLLLLLLPWLLLSLIGLLLRAVLLVLALSLAATATAPAQ